MLSPSNAAAINGRIRTGKRIVVSPSSIGLSKSHPMRLSRSALETTAPPVRRSRNAPLWPALDSGVRLANELHAAPGSHRAFVAEGAGASNVIWFRHAQAAQRHARQEAASAIGKAPAGPNASGAKIRQ